MQTEYHIYEPGSTDEVAASFTSPVPLANLERGNSLLPMLGGRCPSTTARHWLIRHVETYLFAPTQETPLERIRVHVFTEERDRDQLNAKGLQCPP